MSQCKPDALWEIIREQVYRQWRVNQARGLSPDVDIIASKQHAEWFHRMLQRQAKLSGKTPVIVKWIEAYWRPMGMKVRTYRSCSLFLPVFNDINISIPSSSRWNIFALPDYEGGDCFCFLKEQRLKLPGFTVPKKVK